MFVMESVEKKSADRQKNQTTLQIDALNLYTASALENKRELQNVEQNNSFLLKSVGKFTYKNYEMLVPEVSKWKITKRFLEKSI